MVLMKSKRRTNSKRHTSPRLCLFIFFILMAFLGLLSSLTIVWRFHNNEVSDLSHLPPIDAKPQEAITSPAAAALDDVDPKQGGIRLASNGKNCCGPWNCAYFDNKEGNGLPMATLTMDHLASDWQKKIGWEYDGVPILNYTKSNFYLKCHTKKIFQKGVIKFMPYVKADYLRVVLNKQELYLNDNIIRMRNVPDSFVDFDPFHFNATETSATIEVTVGVVNEQRSWIMFSWSRIHSQHQVRLQEEGGDFSYLEKIACAATPVCNGPRVQCPVRETQGLGSGELPWGLCKSFLEPTKRCVVYSFGIRDIYTAELLYGREGCDVYAFDCTVDYPEQLGPNVTFKPWCLGSSHTELKLDGKGSEAMQLAQKGEFMELPQIVKRLGHESSELSILKADCEGCEWNGLESLSRNMPSFFSRIRMFLLEMHFVTDMEKGSPDRVEELKTIARVMDNLRGYRTFGFSINADLSIERFGNPMFYNELYDAGLFVGACCYEFSLVRQDIIPAVGT